MDSSTTRIITALRNARRRIELLESQKAVPIAIVGIGCRFPGAGRGTEGLWRLLKARGDAISTIPNDRWQFRDLFDPTPGRTGKFYSSAGGFLDDVSGFDATFFGMSRIEAERTDPQQRLLLETSYEALEDAGIHWDRREGHDAGVFVGATNNDYGSLIVETKDPKLIDPYFATGNPLNCLAGRIAYWLGARGTCLTVDTACSSSLVAVALACRELRGGNAGIAVAAGVNLILSPTPTIALAQAQMLARDGRCKAFDARADGFVRSEGCAVLILKRLNDALDANDRVHGVIRGININHNGAGAGFMVPSVKAQKQAIENALKDAAVGAETIDFIEAHGTGTALGDPIEFDALNQVYGARDGESPPLWLGSVKTNIGHTEAVAGIAGLIKTVLCLKHKEVPASLHFETPNPAIDWTRSPLRVPTRTQALTSSCRPLRGACSSFGASGVNVHAVVEAIEETPTLQPRETGILFLSASTAKGCTALSKRLGEHLSLSGVGIQDVATTLATRRRQFNFRRAFFFRNQKDAVEKLLAPEREISSCSSARCPIVSLFVGGKEIDAMVELAPIYAEFATFARHVNECIEILARQGNSVSAGVAAKRIINDFCENPVTNTASLTLFIVQSGLAKLLRETGIVFREVLASEEGAVTAEWYAGRITTEDALCRCVLADSGNKSSQGASLAHVENAEPGWRVDLRPIGRDRSVSVKTGAVIECNPLTPSANVVEVIYGLLAQLWEEGYAIDRDQVALPWGGKITTLPSYPFERAPYWALPSRPSLLAIGATSEKKPRQATYVYSTAWRTNGECIDAAPPPRGRRALAIGFSAEERELLASVGGIRHIEAQPPDGDAVERVVLWRWKNPSSDILNKTFNAVPDGIAAFTVQIQKWIRRSADGPVGIILITSDELAIERRRHHSATLEILRAFATVAAGEVQRFFFRVVDLDCTALTQLAAIAAIECDSPRFGEVVMYREGRRFVRTYPQVQLPEVSERTELDHECVYLVTGGLGNIGRAIAERFLEHHRAKVVLTSRQSTWPDPTVDQVDSPRQAFLRKYQGHPSLALLTVDLSAQSEIEQALGECIRRYGRLDGIIHAAGIVSDENLSTAAETKLDDLARHFETKVGAVNAIARALACVEIKPSFVVLMSSISTVLGGLGHAAYAAANAYCAPAAAALDSANGITRWLSIEWDSWTFAHQDMRGFEIAGLLPMQALEVLESLISRWPTHTSLVVAAAPLESRIETWVAKTFDVSKSVPRSVSRTPGREDVEQVIISTCRELLDSKEVCPDANFFELGGDSLTGAKFVSLVQERLGTTVTLQQLLTSATVRDLITSLHDQITVRDSQGIVEMEI